MACHSLEFLSATQSGFHGLTGTDLIWLPNPILEHSAGELICGHKNRAGSLVGNVSAKAGSARDASKRGETNEFSASFVFIKFIYTMPDILPAVIIYHLYAWLMRIIDKH